MKKRLSAIILPAFVLYVFFILTGCNKSTPGTVPTLSTTDVTINAASTSAQSGGFVTAYNDSYLTAIGLCWSSTNKAPTLSDLHSTGDTLKVPSFVSNMTGLSTNTTYYVRAYATNTTGTGYGNMVQFTTGADISSTFGTVSTFAGNTSAGFANGTGVNASFNSPKGIAIDGQGNLYVADSYNSSIRKITPAGLVSTYAGTGSLGYVDGPALSAQFYAVSDLVMDAQNNLYVSDFGNNMIRKISSTGIVSTLAGNGIAGYVDGTGTAAEFTSPRGLALDAAGNLYVADQGNNLIRKITPAGVVTTFTGLHGGGFVDGDNTVARFNHPTGLAFDTTTGILYVADAINHSIRKVATDGSVTTLMGNPIKTTLLNYPSGIFIDTKGNMYISDQSGRIMRLNTAKILYTPAGKANTTGLNDAIGPVARFNVPLGLTVDAQNNIYVADFNNNCIRKIAQ